MEEVEEVKENLEEWKMEIQNNKLNMEPKFKESNSKCIQKC